MVLELSLLFLCIVAIICFDLFRKRHILKFSRNFKGYTFYPVIGNAYHTLHKDAFTVINNVIKLHGSPCNLWNGHDYRYVTTDASEIKVILNHPSTFNKSVISRNVNIVFGNTLILANYNEWKRNRKIFSKSFSQPILNGFVDMFYEKARTLVGILKKSHEMDVYDIFCRLSLDNFCANIMVHDLDVQKMKNNRLIFLLERSIICTVSEKIRSPFSAAQSRNIGITEGNTEHPVKNGSYLTASFLGRKVQRLASKRIFSSYFFPDFLFFVFFPEGWSFLKDVLELRKIIHNIIEQKKHIFEKDKDFKENTSKLPLMDMLLERNRTTFTDEEIFREILLFMIAATETSGISLCYVFTLLGMNPEAQDKIYQEVCQVVGLKGSISHNHLTDLKYTERAIFEAMRLLPVIPFLERRSEADVDLGNKTIPAGANITISTFHLHRSETHWDNPLKFNPDRFLPEAVAERHPYAFLPFSGGPRNCIGMKYAIMMMKTTVAHVIRNYKIRSNYKSVTEMEFESFVTMKTVHDLDCTFISRNN